MTAAMSRETRYRWEPSEPLPEGWRQGAQWLTDDGDLLVLYTSAPPNAAATGSEHKFVRQRRVVQERFVTDWSDVDVDAMTGDAPGRGHEG